VFNTLNMSCEAAAIRAGEATAIRTGEDAAIRTEKAVAIRKRKDAAIHTIVTAALSSDSVLSGIARYIDERLKVKHDDLHDKAEWFASRFDLLDKMSFMMFAIPPNELDICVRDNSWLQSGSTQMKVTNLHLGFFLSLHKAEQN